MSKKFFWRIKCLFSCFKNLFIKKNIQSNFISDQFNYDDRQLNQYDKLVEAFVLPKVWKTFKSIQMLMRMKITNIEKLWNKYKQTNN